MPRITAAIHRYVEQYDPIGFLVGVLLPGEGPSEARRWDFAHGVAREGGLPPDARTIWQIGSLSKTFTATLLAQATQRGLRLDELVQPYAPPGVVLPTYDGDDEPLGPRFVDLATHTAGLPLDPRGVPPEGGYTTEEMYRYLDRYALAIAPGKHWSYSNTGFGLLANILQRFSRMPSYQSMIDELKDEGRLPMPDTTVSPDEAQKLRRAYGYTAPGRRAKWDTSTWPAFDGSGALYSTIDDMMVWLRFNLAQTCSPIDDLLAITQTIYDYRPPQPMGLAWQLTPYAPSGATCWAKDGRTTGFRSYIAFSRELRGGTVILCNSIWADPTELALEIMRALAAPE
ncbi:Penicillin-binding protein AmpH [Minicystis rosea]|nr:Penicillin-binding protein AmpH [Minicystis rosea]